jgi:copper chaperone NosL
MRDTRVKRARRLLLALTAPLLLAACAAGPQPVVWGVEECAHCQMVIADERFAAQVVDARGNAYKFDAIECMADFVNAGEFSAGEHTAWIADGRDGWIAAETATFVRSDAIRSPMGGGLAAHGSADAARELQAQVGGELLTWPEVRQRVAQHGHTHGTGAADAGHAGHDAHAGHEPAAHAGHGAAGGH